MDDLSNPAAESAPLPEANAPAAATPPDKGATTPAPEAGSDTPAPPVEGAATDDTKPEGEKPERPRQKASERIGELYAKAKQAERERDFLRAELQRLQQPVARPEDRDALTFAEQQALDVREAVRAERAVEKQGEAERAEAMAFNAKLAMFDARAEEAKARMPDFDAVAKDQSLPIKGHVAEFILESEKGPEIAYWLGKNRDEAVRIASLPPHRQGAELARIEARITAAPVVRKASHAPAPTPQVGGGSSPSAKDPALMGVEDMQKLLSKAGVMRR